MCRDTGKKWYDGFTFGEVTDIYNPWSIISFLDTGRIKNYWADTSSNSLVGNPLWEGGKNIKMQSGACCWQAAT